MISCKRESEKLEMRSAGPLLPETIGRLTEVFLCILVSVKNSGIRGGFCPEESHFHVILPMPCPLSNKVLTTFPTFVIVEDTIGVSRRL